MTQKTRQFFLFFSLFSTAFSTHCATVITADSQADGESFSFLVGPHVQNQIAFSRVRIPTEAGGVTFYGAASSAAGSSGSYAVSMLDRSLNHIGGITPEKTMLGAQKDQANPLYNKGIKFLAIQEGESGAIKAEEQRPVVVTTDDDTSVHLMTFYSGSTNQVLQAKGIKDAASAVTDGIVGIAAADAYIFAAVKPNGGSFGDANSGIAVVALGEAKTEEAAFSFFSDIQAETGMLSSVGKAYPLDALSDLIKINSDLAALGQVVDLHWDYHFSRLYIALQTTNAGGASDGSRALVVGHFEYNLGPDGNPIKDDFGVFKKTSKLVLNQIGPDAVFVGTDKIVGAIGADEQVSLHKVRTMYTSTRLHYVVVQGNVGTPANTRRDVFALPLTSGSKNQSENGLLANVNESPHNFFADNGEFAGRAFISAAAAPADVLTNADPAAIIGGGQLPGDIDDLFVWRDTVFATVSTVDAGYKSGVFYSQALFNEDGAIKGWTNWQRATTTINQDASDVDTVSGGFFDPSTGQFIILAPDTGATKTIVKRTNFAQGDAKLSENLVETLAQEFGQEDGGILNVVNVPFNAPGIFDIGLLLATGGDKVALIESGRLDTNAQIPTSGVAFDDIERFENGAITANFPATTAKIIIIEGGALSDIAPTCAAAVATDGTHGWIFAGGHGGLTVLSRADGSGWDVGSSKLTIDFDGLADDMTFKKIGDYTNIRKLVYDGSHFLYVLTDTQLDRIDLTSGTPGLGTLTIQTVATAQSLGGPNTVLHDVVISEKCALLGTSAGMFRVGNGANIQTASSVAGVQWTNVLLPIGPQVARRIVPITQTGLEADLVRGAQGGMVYVLDSYRGFERARVHRFAVANASGGTAIDDNTVQHIPDLFFEDQPAFLASLGEFRNELATDGAIVMHARSRNGSVAPNVGVLPLSARSGVNLSRRRPISTVSVDLANGTVINSFIRDSISGGFLLAGDFGLRINE